MLEEAYVCLPRLEVGVADRYSKTVRYYCAANLTPGHNRVGLWNFARGRRVESFNSFAQHRYTNVVAMKSAGSKHQ